MFLDKAIFSTIVENAPLISIDLIVKNEKNEILLGKRVNEPAKNYWFVPGGRIFKDETVANAFKRTVKDEIGLDVSINDAQFHGQYEHFYDNNVFNNNFNTHYIVLSYELRVKSAKVKLNQQHEAYQFFDIDALLLSDKVHKYTKNYFREVQ
ncbi:MAG: GDP-mannose mannosyl hydrolase [Sulfurimonas sp.]